MLEEGIMSNAHGMIVVMEYMTFIGLEINEKYPLETRDHLLFCLDCIIASSELYPFTCAVGPILFSLIKNFNPITMPSLETSVSPFLLGYS